MKQEYYPYWDWEDYKNDMYNKSSDIKDKHKQVIGSIDLLCSPNDFYNVCNSLIKEWKISAMHNLTNTSQNRRAWLGAAASSYKFKTREYLTRIAWNLLNKDEQDIANNIADKVIVEFENKLKSFNDAETLFKC